MKNKKPLKLIYVFEPNPAKLELALRSLAEDFKQRVRLIKDLAKNKKQP